ncbi:acetolactate decarboxylase [Oenococcus oeni]|uniref:acetolactate decarboxylase n=1 Tax=Oenococcus oeni TaxID=1247 RepID=UPI0007A744C2|nr:acetolactate decarboxylase [Oenococcus oeni]KZD14833.1 Alpha-acetolactate decarboxylase [Oenococcus oeni]
MKDLTKAYQHGTLAQIMDGQYDGTILLKDLLEHGDFGIGTTTGIGVELIVLDGVAYGIPSSGKVQKMDIEHEKAPFANINYFDQKLKSESLINLDSDSFQKRVEEEYKLKNVFAAIRVHGEFTNVLARSADKQEKPYPPFSKVAEAQHEFHADSLTATMVGYYSAAMYEGTTAAGFHLHILSDDRQFGGHLLDFKIKKADLQVQIFQDFQLHLPIENPDFRRRELDLETLKKAIEKTE